MDVLEFISRIGLSTTKWTSTSSDNLKTPFDISPQDFIKYAEIDLQRDTDHSVINALSNSKRALDCQLDTLLIAFGYYKKSQAEFWTFPKKISLITDLGILAPRVLHKINKQRNLLEHQFLRPPRESVEDFLDISMLFLASTDKYSLKFISSITYHNDELKKSFSIRNNYSSEALELTERESVPKTEIIPIKLEVNSTKELYKDILKVYLKAY